MSLTLLTGPSGAGKSYSLYEKVIDGSLKHPSEAFFVIVPEQFTMQTQEALASRHPGGVLLNVDVLSFARLAYRVFDETGTRAAELLEETGKTFILEKLALDLSDELPAIRRALGRTTGASEMKSVLSELMQYAVTPEALKALAESEGTRRPLRSRLRDIARLYEAYRDELGSRFLTAEMIPDKLCEILPGSRLLQGAHVYFDGFTGFTPVQMKAVRAILRQAADVTCAVTVDRAYTTRPGADDGLFILSRQMIRALLKAAEETGTPVAPEQFLPMPKEGRFGNSPDLLFLSEQIFRPGRRVREGVPESLSLTRYGDPAQEADGIARTAARLIREEGLRCREIAVLTGDMEIYGREMRRAFLAEGLPYFIDEKRPLLGNPFVEAVRAALSCCADGFTYESVFRLIKTGLTDLTDNEADVLENMAVTCGLRGKGTWQKEWSGLYRGETAEELAFINAARQKVADVLMPLSDALASRSLTVRDKAAALFRFMRVLRIQEKLKGRETAFAETGRYELAREYAQIYGRVMALLEKLVDVLGDRKMSLQDLRRLLEAGLSEMRVGLIPPGTDQIVVGDIERSRLGPVKVLFFAGVNEGLIPKTAKEGGFLSETDREDLKAHGLDLRPSAREAAYIQNDYLYLALTKPSEKLLISCVRSGLGAGEGRPAFLIGLIRRLFPDLPMNDVIAVSPAEAERPADGVPLLYGMFRNLRDRSPDDASAELYGWYVRHGALKKRITALSAGASYRYEKDAVSRETARRLYGRILSNSASRLETFSKCPFRHFAQYGLTLRERIDFGLTSLDRGTILHDALQRFAQKAAANGLSLRDLDEETRRRLSAETLIETAGRGRYFTQTARGAYELTRLTRLLDAAAYVAGEQLVAGDFEPFYLEKSYEDDVLQSRTIGLSDGERMILRGRIDRIDVCDDGGVRYVKVVDYKTGRQAFDLNEVYHGLQLQLVLYMNAALELCRKDGALTVPAGLYYQPVSDPILPYQGGDADAHLAYVRALRGKGVTSSDETVYRHLDRSLAPGGGASPYVPLRLKKDGTPYKDQVTAGASDFETLGVFAVRKAREIGRDILAGRAEAVPYRYKSAEGCDYCPYRAVCRFDSRLPGCGYREIPALKNEDVLQQMRADNDADRKT